MGGGGGEILERRKGIKFMTLIEQIDMQLS